MKPINQKIAIITGDNSGIGSRIKTVKPLIMLGLIMSAMMATVLSFVLTISYVGLAPNFLLIWLHRLEKSRLVGPPIALLPPPVVMKLVGKILKSIEQVPSIAQEWSKEK